MARNNTLRLYGTDMPADDKALIQLTSDPEDCSESGLTEAYDVIYESDSTALVSILFHYDSLENVQLFICYKTANDSGVELQHQGNATWVSLAFIPEPPFSILPLPLEVRLYF